MIIFIGFVLTIIVGFILFDLIENHNNKIKNGYFNKDYWGSKWFNFYCKNCNELNTFSNIRIEEIKQNIFDGRKPSTKCKNCFIYLEPYFISTDWGKQISYAKTKNSVEQDIFELDSEKNLR